MILNPHGWTRPDLMPPMDPLLVPFFRQYMQQVPNLTYPPSKLLLEPDVQDQIYRHFFEGPLKGPVQFQRRVLKKVIELIEISISNPDEDAVSDSLMEHMGYLSSLSTKPPFEEAMETRIITYILPEPFDSRSPPRILIEESPNLLAAGSNVGLRTWEASLHLAQYLFSHPNIVQGKSVLELGAGTGLVSLLCAGALGAEHVLATDGLPHVVESLERNILRNRTHLFSAVSGNENNTPSRLPHAKVLDWADTESLEETLRLPSVATENDDDFMPNYNRILGADITYHPDVVPILARLLSLLLLPNPDIFPDRLPDQVVEAYISATVRQERTLAVFRQSCAEHGLFVEEVQFECPPAQKQRGFFHEQAFPILILRITGRSAAKTRDLQDQETV